MSKTLKLADDLALPLSVVTEKLAFLGRTGTGKTYAAMKLAELMLDAGAQIIALDAVGKWYGLRVAGAGPGFQIPVFGGLHGDYPLESTGGKLIADILVDRGISAVLDVSQFTHGEQNRFALDFATQFYQRKKASPSAVHVFLEECQEFVPQNAMPGEQAMLSAFERLWKLGRNFGIGGSLISQRPQEINKKALNQTGTLVVFGMTGPQERKAIDLWVSAQGVDEDIAEILPTLTPGHPHVWSPTFLGVSKTVAIATKQTADVSSTPVVGKGAKSQPLTPIDAEQLREQMKATIEKAKADDPRELRKQLAELRQQLTKAQQATPINSKPVTLKADPALTDGDRELLKSLRDEFLLVSENIADRADLTLQSIADRAKAEIDDASAKWIGEVDKRRELFLVRLEKTRVQRVLGKLEQVNAPLPPVNPRREVGSVVRTTPDRPEPARQPGRSSHQARPAGDRLPPGERAILTAAAQWDDGVTRDQLGVLTGYKRSSRDAYIARLLQRSLVNVAVGGSIYATTDGIAALGPDFAPLPTGDALLTWWRGRLPVGERVVLEVLVQANGNPVSREAIDEVTGYKRSSRDAYLSRLTARKLVTSVGRGEVRANEELFS